MTQMHTPEPCPFCGETIEVWFQRTHPDLSEGHMKCDRCDAQGPEREKESVALSFWNTRPLKSRAPKRAKKGKL